MDYGSIAIDEIKNGYRFDQEMNAYICNYCGEAFHKGQVYSISGNLYVPEYAAARHIEAEHGGNIGQLLCSDNKYNTLTENQKELMALFHSNTPDKEIAKKLGVSVSTVRRQKFTFREKAKQAKLYLSIFELVFGDTPKNEEAIIPIHDNALYYDDRYVITEQEKSRILETSFESIAPLKLKFFSSKEKKKVVILAKIADQFEKRRSYTEKEVNQILEPIYDDYITIRRYLIMYGFMDRKKDGSSYWLA